MLARSLIVTLIVTCIVAAYASVPVSMASDTDTQSAYGGCWVYRCDDIGNPCQEVANRTNCAQGYCIQEDDGTICGTIQQEQDNAWKCTLRFFDVPQIHRCFFLNDTEKPWQVNYCRCLSEVCILSEVLEECGTYHDECYSYNPN